MRIALIFNKFKEYMIALYVEKVLLGSHHEVRHFWSKDVDSIEKGYDLYFRVDDSDYEHNLPSHLKPSAFWILDAHLKKVYKKVLRMARRYDFVFCGSKLETERLNREGIRPLWAPHGCDPDLHRKLGIEKRYDLGYVGNDGGVVRKFILQELRERYSGSFMGRAPRERMSEIYSCSKIGFNNSDYLGPRGRVRNILNPRFFEIISCGTMLLTNYVDGGSIEALGFEDRRHLVVYHSPREMFELIDYYLRHDDERELIAEEGRTLVQSRHSYLDRVREMFQHIRGGLGARYRDLSI